MPGAPRALSSGCSLAPAETAQPAQLAPVTLCLFRSSDPSSPPGLGFQGGLHSQEVLLSLSSPRKERASGSYPAHTPSQALTPAIVSSRAPSDDA